MMVPASSPLHSASSPLGGKPNAITILTTHHTEWHLVCTYSTLCVSVIVYIGNTIIALAGWNY